MRSLRNHLTQGNPVYWAVAFITLIGAYPRLFYAWTARFPLNDGGLFFTMIKDLESAGYALPAYTSYNSAHIPFAYPPLGFFLASFLVRVFNSPLTDILRLLPPVLSVFTIPVFFLLCRSLLKKDLQAIYATFAFAVLPTSFDWMVMGGGITRTLGFLLALLLFYQVQKLAISSNARHIMLVMLLACLTVLSHLGVAWFALYSAFILAVFSVKDLNGIRRFLIASIGGVVLAMPWWLTIIGRYGLAPFLAAGQNVFSSLWTLAVVLTLAFTNEPVLDFLAVMGFMGILLCLRDRKFLFLAWLCSVIIFQGRSWQFCVVVPFAMLAGIGIDAFLRLLDTKAGHAESRGDVISENQGIRDIPQGLAPRVAMGYMLFAGLLSASIAAPKKYVSQAQLDAMQWIATNAMPEGSFAVITGGEESGVDGISEWFPAIAQRVSVGTPQGYEWLGGEVFERRRQVYALLQNCSTIICLEDAAREYGYRYDYVYLVLSDPSIGRADLLDDLNSSPDFTPVYSHPAVIVFARNVP